MQNVRFIEEVWRLSLGGELRCSRTARPIALSQELVAGIRCCCAGRHSGLSQGFEVREPSAPTSAAQRLDVGCRRRDSSSQWASSQKLVAGCQDGCTQLLNAQPSNSSPEVAVRTRCLCCPRRRTLSQKGGMVALSRQPGSRVPARCQCLSQVCVVVCGCGRRIFSQKLKWGASSFNIRVSIHLVARIRRRLSWSLMVMTSYANILFSSTFYYLLFYYNLDSVT